MVQFGRFALDVERRQVWRDGAEVRLTPMAFNLLTLLVNEASRVVPKEEIHRHLWPETFVSEATLLGLVKEIRRVLDNGDPSSVIRTVHRVGYGLGVAVGGYTPAAAASRHWLTHDGRRIVLQHGVNVIGRDPQAAVWLDVASVSRRHAHIVIAGTDARVEDLGSKNGTIVGTDRIGGAVALRSGDRISIGPITLTYRCAPAEPTTETQVRDRA